MTSTLITTGFTDSVANAEVSDTQQAEQTQTEMEQNEQVQTEKALALTGIKGEDTMHCLC